jgi:hypothetical protein
MLRMRAAARPYVYIAWSYLSLGNILIMLAWEAHRTSESKTELGVEDRRWMKLAHNRAVGLQCASVLVVLIFRFLL